ncbi:hypothetical protein BDR05DRAFT_964157 [Suillus weaverae]|nr:hypothetical protein BDR05DRAFT_964157 [Suillus weaverae]
MPRVRKQKASQCLRRVGGARNTVYGGESDIELSRVEINVSVLQTKSQVNGYSGGTSPDTVDSSSNKNH